MTPRALIYVQHLLGVGHLARIRRIAQGLVEAGMRVTIAQGGADAGIAEIAGAQTVRLTPTRVAADDMTTLLHDDGRLFTEADKAARRDALLATLDRTQPDALIVEAFPFGRRQMRFELVPLLDRATSMGVPVIACSIRDILQESRKPGRAEETVALVEAYFDLVLVHGDEAVTPLSMTFELAPAFASKIRYTGLVGPKRPDAISREHDVVVSAGGGSVGVKLLRAAIAAAPLSSFRDSAWLVLAGSNMPEEAFLPLRRQASQASRRINLMRSVPDLAAHLSGARLSVSQAGYNTVADVLVAGCASVLVPFAQGGETEQTVRATTLAAAGRVVMVGEDDLAPERLAAAMDAAIALPAAAPMLLDGGARTARILLEAIAAKARGSEGVEPREDLRSSLLQEGP